MNDLLLRAARGERTERTPVWLMRQAGRTDPEYNRLRETAEMPLEALFSTPELAARISLLPRRLGVDAIIIFQDILTPLAPMGAPFLFRPGPMLERPVRSAQDMAALRPFEMETGLAHVRETFRMVHEMLGGALPVLGFAGAQFTLAAYLVEGRPSRDHLGARRLMHSDPGAWAALTSWAADLTGAFLRAQVLAGASAVQLFDSWAGSLTLADYERYVAPASARALAHVRDLGVPLVHFGTGTGHLLSAMRDVGAGVIGVDYRTPLDEASRILGGTTPLQGNLDPALLAAPWPVLEAAVKDVVLRGREAPAHVLNLGHGVPPDTDPGVLTRVVDLVHSLATR